nr:2,4'-dihydroxyacetophenone dioxygenase family protein [uncultured Sphingorhabdus sp.]
MGFYFENIDTAVTDVEALPWVPFLPYSDELHIKLIKADPVRGEWITLLRVPPNFELPKHRHSGTVHVYTIAGTWKYKEHDWSATPGSFVFETAGTAHTPVSIEGEVITLNIVQGDWLVLGEDDAVLAIEDWRTVMQRYLNYCQEQKIAPVDLTSFSAA